MLTRRNSQRNMRTAEENQFSAIPREFFVTIICEYLTFVEWGRLDVALYTHDAIRGAYLEALRSEAINLSVEDNLLWDKSLKKGVLKWIIRKGIRIISWNNKHYSHLKSISISESVSSLKTCKRLDISDCSSVTETGLISLLRRLPYLEELSVGACFNIMDEGMKTIVKFSPNLKYLDVRKCLHVTDEGLSVIADGLTHLTHLYIGCCRKITAIGIADAMTRLSKLHVLDISGLDITPTKKS